jgi:two-component system, LytTR family, response regulator
MTLKTVLVDDELLARDMLRTLLAEHSDIEIVATCKSAEEAIAFLEHNACDLLFLDIQMPRKDGFAVVEEIGLDRLPATVFVTAYHEYAVRAFDVQAIDYLTKPTNPERLRLALARVRERERT